MAGLMIGLSCRDNSLSPFDIVPICEKNVIKVLVLLLAAVMICFLAASGNSSSQGETTQSTDNASASTQEQAETTVTADTASTGESAETASAIGTVANTLAEDEDTLIATYADKFEQKTYSDSESGLSITYNLYLPEGYDASGSYPMVVFIGDSSCAGSDGHV